MLLEFENVTGNSKKFNLQDISFSLPAGYIMGLVGENGAGKTTLFHYIIDEKKNYTGEIRVNGQPIHEDHVKLLDEIGFVSEEQDFFMDKTIRENEELLGLFYSKWDGKLFDLTLQEMQLSKRRTLSKLSRGEYLKFQLAFARAHHPRLYLLDEVTAGMDPVYRVDFFKLLQQVIMDGETSVLMTTHLMEEMKRRMDYVGVLRDGRLMSFGEGLVI